MSLSPPSASVGDRCPEFLLPPEAGMTETFCARHAGRPVVLIVARSVADLVSYGSLSTTHAILGLVPGPGTVALPAAIPALQVSAQLVRMLGLSDDTGRPVVWVLDATLRLRQRLDGAEPSQLRDALDSLSAAALAAPPVVMTSTAPVLMLPGVLNAAVCRQLIETHAADHHASGMLRQIDGQVVLRSDERIKRRHDHTLTAQPLVDAVVQALSRRVLPEIATAFQYTVTRLEGFKLVAYDAADAGCFRPHRDNTTPEARHRRFALTLALDDDFDGGCLRFPEHGQTLYRPPTGGAIVFSGSLLHEVTEVTRGRRHALLSFLWGDEAGR
jgi:predicted 2-oxoglutarate/Fe(II)-dependent dioxygenase YbiX